MNLACRSKRATLVALALTTFCGAANAQETTYPEAQRELNIMRNIFAAALEQDEGRNRMRFAQPEALYLAGQGMVFTFNLSGGLNPILLSSMQSFGTVDVSGPQVNVFGNGNYQYIGNERADRITGILSAGGDDSSGQARLRELTEMLRDRQEEMSDLQRDLRRLQRAQRNDDSLDNDAEIARVEDAIDALTDELERGSDNYRQAMTAYQDERNAALETRRQTQTGMIFNTLCEYGNTLHALEGGEHVSLVLRNFTADETRIFVIEYADIAACTSAQNLQENALSYPL